MRIAQFLTCFATYCCLALGAVIGGLIQVIPRAIRLERDKNAICIVRRGLAKESARTSKGSPIGQGEIRFCRAGLVLLALVPATVFFRLLFWLGWSLYLYN
jgi:hypothetical protein